MKDISNIFNLPPDELGKKHNSHRSLWADTAPQIKAFAVNLSKFIAKVDTPYVLGLDGGYGTGKTHFSTRFSVMLNKSITTVYFSVWEQDYMVDPFVVFAEKIIWIARKQAGGTELVTNILTSVAAATKVRAEFGIWGLFKVGAELSGKDLINKLFPKKQRSDLFIELKILLSQFIQSLPKKKLVLIVDELDRCRPDYAVKVLETIKHFFDIPGLLFILPINSERLNTYVQGFYNIHADQFVGKEDYLQKFINETIEVPELNYNRICEDKIKISEFGANVSNIHGIFNSIHELKKWIAEYAKKSKLSYRETIEIIKRAKYFCKNYPEPIRCRLLANRLCNKLYKHNNKNHSNINARNAELSFGVNYMYTTITGYNSESQKDILLKADAFNNGIFLQFGGKTTTTAIENTCNRVSNLKQSSYSYAGMYSTIDNVLNELNQIDIENYDPPRRYYNEVSEKELSEKVQTMKDFLAKKKQDLLDFQHITGSDDNDAERLTKYENKIQDPTALSQKN